MGFEFLCCFAVCCEFVCGVESSVVVVVEVGQGRRTFLGGEAQARDDEV